MNVIQIGANKGYDDVTELIRDKKIDKLVLVEPFNEHNKSLTECYSWLDNKVIQNIIIQDDPTLTESSIFYHTDDSNHTNAFELASLNKGHSLKIRGQYTEDGIIERKLECMTINQLFAFHGMHEIDLLFIDTEGYDCKIIKSLNFEKYNVKELYYENLHCDVSEIRKYLESVGYEVTPNVFDKGWSDKAVRK